MSKANPDDLIVLAERIIAVTEDAGEEQITIQTYMARSLLEMAKRAPRPRRGRPPVPGRDIVRDSMTVHRARSRKTKLLAEAKAEGRSLTADDAAWQAANEEARKSRLSAADIRERMDRRSRR
jgi:hypothetical protein